ncbi:MAG: T9SS type A sorting domain-containing protein [Gemmatimonadales bacterium]|nr:T9SS type A sorting domain-containing protein [Gemmatimonadales bacterium]
MNRPMRLVAVLTLLAIYLSALPCLAIKNQSAEDFTSTILKDTVNTTANWNTVAEELSLYPLVPTLLGNLPTSGDAWDLVVSGNHAFLVDVIGLKVINIEHPDDPQLAGYLDTDGDARGVAIHGDYAFVADGTFGLQIINISNPALPQHIVTYDTPDFAFDVVVSGNFAYVADWDGGLQVVNISNPSNPLYHGHYETPGDATGVAVSGDFAFVADYGAGFLVLNIINPASPLLLGQYDTPGHARRVTVEGDYAFVADSENGLRILSILDPENPTYLGDCLTPGDAYDVTATGDYAYVAALGSGLQVIDISNIADPQIIEEYDTSGQARGVAVAGTCAFVADYDSGLQVIEIAKPMNVTPVGALPTLDYAMGIQVEGDYAFVATALNGIQVVNITDTANPILLGGYNTPGNSQNLSVEGNYAFVADGSPGLWVIDITDPTNIPYPHFCPTVGEANDVAIAGNYAFVAVEDARLQVIDITNPESPVPFETLIQAEEGRRVEVAGDYVYVVDRFGIKIYHTSVRETPFICGYYGSAGNPASALAISGNYAFLANGSEGLQVVDITNPEDIQFITNFPMPGYSALDITVQGDYAFVSLGFFGIQVIDISDPTNPALLETYDTPGSVNGLAVEGDCLFVADWDAGLQIFQVFQQEVYTDDNIGQSLFVDETDDTIFRARLTTNQTANVAWELSADGGGGWQEILPDASWNKITVPGSDLLWRSTHNWSPGLDPTVFDLTLEWLYNFAPIKSIVDVPGDQGGRVDVTFSRSTYDFADETSLPVTGYNIYRLVEEGSLAAKGLTTSLVKSGQDLLTPTGIKAWPIPGEETVTAGGDFYVVGVPSAAEEATFPPGTWKLVSTAFATQSDTYIVEATTAADSTGPEIDLSVYLVTTHTTTPSVWFASQPESGYSVDNLAPGVPTAVAAAYQTDSVVLDWNDAPETDFQYYRIYRDTDPGFVPSPANLIQEIAVSSWTDPTTDPWDYHYKITTLDYTGNESEAGSPESVSGVRDGSLPSRTALLGAVPNPFNPLTKLSFEMATPGNARLKIFDAAGRLVATLVDEHREAGRHQIVWDGRDGDGRMSSAGVYLYRLEADGFIEAKRMVLIK